MVEKIRYEWVVNLLMDDANIALESKKPFRLIFIRSTTTQGRKDNWNLPTCLLPFLPVGLN